MVNHQTSGVVPVLQVEHCSLFVAGHSTGGGKCLRSLGDVILVKYNPEERALYDRVEESYYARAEDRRSLASCIRGCAGAALLEMDLLTESGRGTQYICFGII